MHKTDNCNKKDEKFLEFTIEWRCFQKVRSIFFKTNEKIREHNFPRKERLKKTYTIEIVCASLKTTVVLKYVPSSTSYFEIGTVAPSLMFRTLAIP